MPDAERVSLDEVRRVAELGYVELTPEEESRMARDLNAILDYVAQLGEVDTSQVAPMAQVAEVATADQAVPIESPALREDTPRPCLSRDRVMESAPETDGVYFKVPKVIER